MGSQKKSAEVVHFDQVFFNSFFLDSVIEKQEFILFPVHYDRWSRNTYPFLFPFEFPREESNSPFLPRAFGMTGKRYEYIPCIDAVEKQEQIIEAITGLVEETRSAGLVVEFAVLGERRTLDSQTRLTLYRVAQEGLTNVRKHARASRVDVVLDYSQPKQIGLAINDNGVGTSLTAHDGFGLIGMRERVQLLGGRLTIESAIGEGFRLETAVPG